MLSDRISSNAKSACAHVWLTELQLTREISLEIEM